ncbi:MAG: site-specific integrase [Phycisphaerae bacterium]|nr:site-specific integrase [Phycisphaerae bacterium]
MANVFRKTYTQPLPKHVEIVERRGRKMAMWFDRRGRRKYDEITTGRRGEVKIVRQSPTYIARYRDADGVEQFESTGCKDEQAARHVLADILKRVEHMKAGIITPAQDRQANHADRPIRSHVADYLEHLRAKTVRGRKVSAAHRENVERQLERIVADCRFRLLRDVDRGAMEKWMNRQEAAQMGARTRNMYRAAIVSFCNWCVEADRLPVNPLAKLCSADEHVDRRRTRRALTEDEIGRLLEAARRRPVAELGRGSTPKPKKQCKGRSTWSKAELTFETLENAYRRGRGLLKDEPDRLAELELLGQERRLIYKTMILTGLRKGELASLTAGQLALDGPRPYAELLAKHEKSGRGAQIPLRRDLVTELQAFLAKRLLREQKKTRCKGKAMPMRLPAGAPLFNVPRDLLKIFDRDLATAGIAKKDERGRTVDLHALRHTFGTHLSKAGVAPRVAMAAMRHSSLDLTMNIYTDPVLLDVGAAVDALPSFDTPERPVKAADPA